MASEIWVNGDGPTPCKIAFVGESPGLTEVKTGIPFSGKSGREFDKRWLPVAGLKRSNVYVTNLSKRHIPTPTPKLMEDWELNLMWELQHVKPDYVITLGRFAAWAFIDGQPNMDEIHGIPFHAVSHYNQKCIVIPCYHPAAGLHNPGIQESIHHDFEVVKGVIEGSVKPRAYKEPKHYGDYNLRVADTGDIIRLGPVAVDTENYPDGTPWGFSWSNEADGASYSGLVQRCKTSNCVIKSSLIILHHSLHDLGMLDKIGITLDGPIVDTMIMAHLVGTEPKGLKALARRHLGLEMSSYMEMIGPYETDLIRAYMEEYKADVLGRLELRDQNRLKSLIKRANSDWRKGKKVDFRKRWKGWDPKLVRFGTLPQANLDHLPVQAATDYAGKDAYATRLLHPILDELIKAKGLEKVLEQDMGVVPMLAEMQKTGIHVDGEKLQDLNDSIEAKLIHIECEITNVAFLDYEMEGFNVDSYDSVSDLLFNYIKLTPIRKTKKGKRPSVAKGVLEAIKDQHEVVPLLIERSELEKLRNTYTHKLPGFIKQDGKIYPNISLIRTPTGRIAMKAPNLMAQPARTEIGRKIRGCFYAPEGWELASWDLDQIELRVLAHLSEDETLTKVLRDPLRHIHKETCSKIYGIPIEQVDKASTEYMMTKNITFGIVYLISPQGLHSQLVERGLTITLDECEKWIKEWYKIYEGVYNFQEAVKSEARMVGYVVSPLGRRRYTGGSRSPNRATANEALRQAVNHPIQAGAQEVIKAGMIKMWPWVSDHDWLRPLLQVHDELIFQVRPDWLRLCDAIVSHCMTTAVKLRVPVRVSMAHGKTWEELK
jgi:uracil-DNA glycosylase family 4